MNNFDEFLATIEKCTKQCRTMIDHEQEKRAALLSGDEKKLENTLQILQADIMKLEQLEKKRLEQQTQAGFESLTANDIMKLTLSVDQKTKLSSSFDDLKNAAEELRLYNAKALDIAKSNLRFIESFDSKRKPVESPATYRPGQGIQSEQSTGKSFQIKI